MTAIVTGAGGALGGAVVHALLDAGHSVVAVDRAPQVMAALPEQVVREAADLTDAGAVDALFDRVAASAGSPAVVVHAVGAFRGGTVSDSTPEDYRFLMGVNLDAAWWVTRSAARLMQAQGGGVVVHVGARNGVEAAGGSAAYSVTKAALVHLVRIADAELRPHGVRVNAVLPALIDTPANRAALGAAAMQAAVSPGAIAGVIAFLASDVAAAVSGALVPVYGRA